MESSLRYVYSDFDSPHHVLLEKSELTFLENYKQIYRPTVIETFKIIHRIAPAYLGNLMSRRDIGCGTRQLFDVSLYQDSGQLNMGNVLYIF